MSWIGGNRQGKRAEKCSHSWQQAASKINVMCGDNKAITPAGSAVTSLDSALAGLLPLCVDTILCQCVDRLTAACGFLCESLSGFLCQAEEEVPTGGIAHQHGQIRACRASAS